MTDEHEATPDPATAAEDDAPGSPPDSPTRDDVDPDAEAANEAAGGDDDTNAAPPAEKDAEVGGSDVVAPAVVVIEAPEDDTEFLKAVVAGQTPAHASSGATKASLAPPGRKTKKKAKKAKAKGKKKAKAKAPHVGPNDFDGKDADERELNHLITNQFSARTEEYARAKDEKLERRRKEEADRYSSGRKKKMTDDELQSFLKRNADHLARRRMVREEAQKKYTPSFKPEISERSKALASKSSGSFFARVRMSELQRKRGTGCRIFVCLSVCVGDCVCVSVGLCVGCLRCCGGTVWIIYLSVSLQFWKN